MAVWIVKGGRTGEFEDLFLAQGLIGKGGTLPDLSSTSSPDDVRRLYVAAFPEAKQGAASNHTGQFWSLRSKMNAGELVVLPLKTTGTIAVGKISGLYQYRTDLLPDLFHVRPVNWIKTDIPRDSFDQDLLYSFGAFITIGRVKRDQAEERILAVLEGRKAVVSIADAEETGLSAEESPDVEAVAREQVRQYISRNFAGHNLARLVAAVLEAQGFVTKMSPPGADQGVDILGGWGALGLDSPRLVVQVKTGQAGVEEFRSLRGLLTSMGADQGLLVAWRGFKGTVRAEARLDYFKVRLWEAEELINAMFDVYSNLPDDLLSELPLKRFWGLVPALD